MPNKDADYCYYCGYGVDAIDACCECDVSLCGDCRCQNERTEETVCGPCQTDLENIDAD